MRRNILFTRILKINWMKVPFQVSPDVLFKYSIPELDPFMTFEPRALEYLRKKKKAPHF
jgi:hypothetical protein